MNINDLENLAKKATPGEWKAFRPGFSYAVRAVYYNEMNLRCTAFIAVVDCGAQDNKTNAEYIAACQPSNILALIEENKQLKKELDYLSKRVIELDMEVTNLVHKDRGINSNFYR